ncbi:aKG-HExxH-type peptide beta-hydroxylase [Acetobacter syzygii]|uniref:aKG-HExxH-type peptide beta-hydroxylase n=1 Tax=Acetobacter syzygii TaxID=146476 RepID=UPI0039E7D865
MTTLHDRIRAAFGSRGRRWFDGLAAQVAKHAWSKLAHVGISQANYGTARVLLANPAAPRVGFSMRNAGLDRPVPLERFDATMRARYDVIGLREPKICFDAAYFEAELARAMHLIDIVPAVGAAVRQLVWSITPVDVEGLEYDTGYSDPAVPFSIFIGAHAQEDRVPAIRLAEGVLHEAMHLQLSLIEDKVRLVGGSAERWHSPWQGCLRPTQGILHGLYVFRVVQDWLCAILIEPGVSSAEINHARGRIAQIDDESDALADLVVSEDLTLDGKLLVGALRA